MNGDRSLAREELSQCLKGCFLPGFGLEADEIEDAERDIIEMAMKKLDVNHDGQITFDDFMNAVRGDPLLVQACGPCLISPDCMARFLFTVSWEYRGYTNGLLGYTENTNRRSLRSSRHFTSMASTTPTSKAQLQGLP